MNTRVVYRRELRAMSCSASIVVVADGLPHDGGESLLARAAERIDELERRWSRFLDDSEITGLNGAAGAPRRCSSDTVELVESMVSGWTATEGRFDPSLLGWLLELGYSSSRTSDGATTVLLPGTGFGRRLDLIRVDRANGVIQLPDDLTLDPGGVGKGLAADIVAREVASDAGVHPGVLVEIGGDIRVAGVGPDDGAWTVEVAHPLGGEPEVLRLVSGGVATSTNRLRTWRRSGSEHHHLLDPTTGRSTDTDVVGCTVVAGTAAWAEVFTKCAFVDGADAAVARYADLGLAARVVTDDGATRHTPAWKAFAS